MLLRSASAMTVYTISDLTKYWKKKQQMRFKLERRPGEDPLRFEGVEARPTSIEKAEYFKVRDLIKWT